MSLKVLKNKSFYFYEFIEDCLLALEAVENNPSFTVDMSYWALDRGRTCSLCMGGSLFAAKLGYDKTLVKGAIKKSELESYYEEDFATGLHMEYLDDEEMKALMRAGDALRLFNFGGAYQTLDYEFHIKDFNHYKYDELNDYFSVTDEERIKNRYDSSPKKFKELLLNVYGYCASNKI